ncbi:MAG: hypothetical protein AAF634_17835 [Bacteroidota bacterium]
MKGRKSILGLVLLGALFSCQNDDNASTPPSEFSIKANILQEEPEYEQTVFDGGSNGNVNVFNRADRTIYLSTFKNGTDDSEGFWTIRISDVDIEALNLPYTLTGTEGSVTWVDEAIQDLQGPCSAADVLCFYAGIGVDEVQITIDRVENNSISGSFAGKLYHIRVNPSVERDENDIVEIRQGTFKMKYLTE